MNGRRSRKRRAEALGLTVRGARMFDELERERLQAIRDASHSFDEIRKEIEEKLAAAHDGIARTFEDRKRAIYEEHGVRA